MFLSLKTLYRKRTVIWPFYFYTIIRTLSGRPVAGPLVDVQAVQALRTVVAMAAPRLVGRDKLAALFADEAVHAGVRLVEGGASLDVFHGGSPKTLMVVALFGRFRRRLALANLPACDNLHATSL